MHKGSLTYSPEIATKLSNYLLAVQDKRPSQINKMPPINELKNAFIQKSISKCIHSKLDFSVIKFFFLPLIEAEWQDADTKYYLRRFKLALLISV